ncbi:MAG: hypothetical protein ACRDV8_02020, partial [Acidimicrobiales bacterium]
PAVHQRAGAAAARLPRAGAELIRLRADLSRTPRQRSIAGAPRCESVPGPASREADMAREVEPQTRGGMPQRSSRGSRGLRPLHTLAVVAVGVVGVLVAFWALSSIVGIVWGVVKVVVIVAVIAGLVWLLAGRRRR